MKTRFVVGEKETESFGMSLAPLLHAGDVLWLRGELGAGKTAFTRGFARGLGIQEPVSSPTFTIVQEYAFGDSRMLYHMDLYRIADSDAALAFGIDDFLFDRNAICLIEWPERAEDLYPADAVNVEIEHTAEENRRIIRIRR